MSFINEDQSWELLQHKVFGQQSCPLQLVEVGKKIAKNCGGLPLTIVVVAENVMREEVWENVSENISSREPTIALQCSKILCFSYDRLRLRLKPCFLYIAAFPEDSEIDVSKLLRLWVAEGFLKPNDGFKCLEDVGEHYLEDLVKRSLLLVSRKGPDGKLETVGIHDMMREICLAKAEEERFLFNTNSSTYFIENPCRRLLIHSIDDFWDEESRLRSVVISPRAYYYLSRLNLRSRHICILDTSMVRWRKHSISRFNNLSNLQTLGTVVDFIFAEEIIKILVHLKKLKVEYHTRDRDFNLENIFHLHNLEDLHISMHSRACGSRIWYHAFPMGLKKLSLKGVHFGWENMTIIGSLPNLQVLHMMDITVHRASEWRTKEGEFLQLKYFHSSLDLVVKWEMEKEHFPCLETLILEGARRIHEIPSGIGEIDTLQYIELKDCKRPFVDSTKQIQKHQHENGNDAFRVRVIDSDGEDVLF
ncbi:putative late blight resistance protein homolog R1A-10 [Henckelia pumila]|uniref:putative late blight resistance protein homolog R1A-10 n=1 Tax=Henckelia pumila TaxID=405737 RepID=UPI003C6E09FC